jgi:prolyl-tRNA synthetase
MQDELHQRALTFRAEHTKCIDSLADFDAFFTPKRPGNENEPSEIHGGFALARFCGDPAVEAQVKERLGVTVRCVPIEGADDAGPCVITGRPATQRVVWAKAY